MSYDAVLEQLLEVSQAKERELADQVARLRAKDLKRVKRIETLNQELAKAYENIGQLNSMIVRKDETLAGVRRSHENQALTIASLQSLANDHEAVQTAVRYKDTVIAGLKQRVKTLDGFLVTRTAERDKARSELEESKAKVLKLAYDLDAVLEDERCDCAPNLALAACKKKLEQLEGMLEAQRRNTRELGVNLQRVRDEKAAMKEDLRHKQRELDTANELSRQHQTQRDQAYKERLDTVRLLENRNAELVDLRSHFSEAADLDKRKNRALSLLRRATSILDPVQVSGIESTFTEGRAPEPDWGAAQFLRAPSWQQQHQATRAKKAQPRVWTCGRFHQGHNCDLNYPHGPSDGHHCHCGQWWGSK